MDDPRVILGPKVGEDAAAIDMGDAYLIAKSDPITFATDAIGWYAVHVNANDVACTGASPLWFLATLLLPAGRADGEMVDAIFDQLLQACDETGITLIGGHTEITYGIDRPIMIGMMLGEVKPKDLVRSGGAQPGDHILMTKRVAVEATAIIAREKWDALLQREDITRAELERWAHFLYDPGISVLRSAQVATGVADVHAMHDPTEGGVATGLHELAVAAGVGLEIDAAAIPIYPETQKLCDIFELDPLGLIASGSLLLTVEAEESPKVCQALEEAGIEATVIGRVRPPEAGTFMRHPSGKTVPLPAFERDEIGRLFE
jgi:hydrogenase maturation factor